MLYLMMDKASDGYFVKVGQAKRPKERRKAYTTHNPTAIMRSTCAGTDTEERHCHKILEQLGTKVGKGEWYRVPLPIFNKLYLNGMNYFYPKKKAHDKEYFD